MWYKAAKPFIDNDQLNMLGVVQEQHSQRTLLYQQWKQFDFPILQDAANSLNLAAVPIPIFIDEFGVVQNPRPRPTDLAEFVQSAFARKSIVSADEMFNEFEKYKAEGLKYLNAPNQQNVDAAISEFQKALKIKPEDGPVKFHMGVAYRMKFDSESGIPHDFSRAVELWHEALAINPNQYIWRRRIEQYGPKLSKPYPFYNWVEKAISEINDRGELPVELAVDLTGSERAEPGLAFAATAQTDNPDPENKIFEVDDQIIRIESTSVTAPGNRQNVVRIHLALQLDSGKWNMEAGPIEIWIDESSDGQPEKRLLKTTCQPDRMEKSINVDFEFKVNQNSNPSLNGFVLFHMCDQEGVCYYRRKNFSIKLTL